MRVRWLIATALAYGVPGGVLLYDQLWDRGRGLTWTQLSTQRVAWAAIVFLVSTLLVARRHPGRGARWMALHAAGAFLLGAAIGWGVVELNMLQAPHPWDRDVPGYDGSIRWLYCSCRPFLPVFRRTLIATAVGTVAAAVLAPLVARVVRAWRPRPASLRSG